MTISQTSPETIRTPMSPALTSAIATALITAFLVAGSVAAILIARGLEQKTDWVEHTLTVRDEAKSAILMLTQAESANRGYLITSDDNYREPYLEARREISGPVSRLRALTADHQEQSARADAFAAAINAKLRHMEGLQATAARDGFMAARDVVDTDRGLGLMKEATRVADEIVAVEERLLRARRSSEDRQRRLLSMLLAGLFIATIGLAWLSYGTARNQLARARGETRSAKLLNDELEERVRRRTADLELERARAVSEAERADRERERVELLLRDLNHRIGNNLSMVSAMLGMQASRVDDEAGKSALSAARERIYMIGSVQRRLRLDDDLQTTGTRALFTKVVDDLVEAQSNAATIKVEHDYADVPLDSRDAVTLAIVLGELVTNALKHAFPTGRPGAIAASFNRNDDGVFVLEVADDGAGLPAEGTRPGIGSTVVNEMSRQFGGEVVRRNGETGGVVVTVTLDGLKIGPAPPPDAGAA